AEVLVFGPRTAELESLLAHVATQGKRSNLRYAGYVDSPAEALAQLDVLVNLSHVQESFGRTVLEAMAAARPVVAYDWGALPELIIPGETGFLAQLGDTAAVVEHLKWLAAHPEERRALGAKGRQRALTQYGQQTVQNKLVSAYRNFGLQL